MSHVLRFLRFWYDFVVGDDWQIAAGVVVAVGLTLLLGRHGVHAWWLVPAAVALLLASSVWRSVRSIR